MVGGGIRNREGRDKFLTGDLVEEAEVKMEEIVQITVLCGNI